MGWFDGTPIEISQDEFLANETKTEDVMLKQGLAYHPALMTQIRGTGPMVSYVYNGSSVAIAQHGRVTIVSIGGYSIFYIRHSTGKIYYMREEWFLRDVELYGVIAGVVSAKGTATFANLIVRSIAIGYGGAAAWIIIGGEFISGTSPSLYEEKDGPTFPEVIEGLSALLTARRILKACAPTLYSKLFSAFVMDCVKNYPKVLDAETFFTWLGQIAGYGIKEALFKDTKQRVKFVLSVLMTTWRVLKVALKILSPLAKSASVTAHSYVKAAEEIIRYLKNILEISISPSEEKKIHEEVKKEGHKITDTLQRLQDRLRPIGARVTKE